MTRKLVSTFLLVGFLTSPSPANAELIRHVSVSIVTKPADLDTLRNQIAQARTKAEKSCKEAREKWERVKTSRRPDKRVLVRQADTVRRLADEHLANLKTRAAVEELLQAAILATAITDSLCRLLEEEQKQQEEQQGDLRPQRERQYTFDKLLITIEDAQTSVMNVERKLKENIKRHNILQRLDPPIDINPIKENLIQHLGNLVCLLDSLKCLLQNRLKPSESISHAKKTIQYAACKARKLEGQLRVLSGAEYRRKFLIQIIYGNGILKTVVFFKGDPQYIDNKDKRGGFVLKDRDRKDTDVEYRNHLLPNGEVLHLFEIALGSNGIPESTSGKAKLRIIKNYNREQPEYAWGIWDIKDVLVTGYRSSPQKPERKKRKSRKKNPPGRKLVYGTRITLIRLTLVRNNDAEVLFSEETPERRYIFSSEPARSLQRRPTAAFEEGSPKAIHRVIYEWPFQNAVN